MPFTNGFETPGLLTEKFHKHVTLQAEFDYATEAEYLEAADAFIGGPLPDHTWECHRRNGDLIRYNEMTDEFAVLRVDRVIKTYFRADSAEHDQPTNLEYFRQECRK